MGWGFKELIIIMKSKRQKTHSSASSMILVDDAGTSTVSHPFTCINLGFIAEKKKNDIDYHHIRSIVDIMFRATVF